MKVYRVAVIGCGQMGEVHLKKIYCKQNVELYCVCDLLEDVALEMQRKYNAKFVELDYKKCLLHKEIDVVIIATYSSSHLEILRACLDANKHVICEKPIATSIEEAEEFYRIVTTHTSSKVLIGHILRHNITYTKVQEMVQSGKIGKPIVMRMVQNHHTMNWNRYLRLINDTSPVVDCGVHYFDMMQKISGAKIIEVSGIGARTENNVPADKYNYAMVTLKLSDESIGFYEVGWGNSIQACNVKEFVGPKGRISMTFAFDRVKNKEEGDLIEFYDSEKHTYEQINVLASSKPTDLMFDYLIGMIEDNLPANPTIEEALESFKISILADRKIRESIKR